ncbi:MAG: ECF transporter S component [Tissierellia bacterium]|nr:ECF transporter S component [Tissierellia bacterium]
MKLRDLILSALFMALVAVVTLVVNIPIPGTKGYLNASEVAIFLSVLVLKDKRAILAAGLGAALADLLLGYTFYAPATLVAKGLEAGLALFLLERTSLPKLLPLGAGALLMALTYFLYEWGILYRDLAVASLGLVPNLTQGFFGLAVALVIYPLLDRALDLNHKNL